MELRKLVTEEMGQVSAAWVATGGAARTAIEGEPMLSPLLPKLVAVHAAIVAAGGPSNDPEVRRLMAEEARLDSLHDELVRGIHGTLSMLAKVSKSADELLRLRDRLFPEGLRHTNRSYRAEAGHAVAVATAMSTDAEARMKTIQLGDHTLLDLYNQWQDAAKQLGALEEQRAHLGQAAATPAAQYQAARRDWIRWANVLTETAENAEVDAATDALLFSPLRAALQRANSRWKSGATQPASPVATPPATQPAAPVTTAS